MAILTLFQELKKVIPGFNSFSIKEAGEASVLKVMLEKPGGNGLVVGTTDELKAMGVFIPPFKQMF